MATKKVSRGDGVRRRKVLVQVLERSERDALDFMSEAQWVYVLGVVGRLEDFGNWLATSDLRLEKVDAFWELKLKGNALGRINVRVFFAFLSAFNEVVVLMVRKKESNGSTPPHWITRLEARLRQYLAIR